MQAEDSQHAINQIITSEMKSPHINATTQTHTHTHTHTCLGVAVISLNDSIITTEL